MKNIHDNTSKLIKQGITPGLAIVRIGDDEASKIYVGGKLRQAASVGMHCLEIHLPQNCTQDEVLANIQRLNRDPAIHGIICQLPLPQHLSSQKIVSAIEPIKDIDGLHPTNIGRMVLGTSDLTPCTPAGIIELLRYYHIETKARRVVIIGRSNIVGRPLSILLSQRGLDATVSLCHSFSDDIQDYTRSANIIITAVGQPEWLKDHMVSPGVVVIDVGINRRAGSKKICGDVDFAKVSKKAAAITPVPGGVGLLTVTMVLRNVLTALTLQHKNIRPEPALQNVRLKQEEPAVPNGSLEQLESTLPNGSLKQVE